MNRYSYCVGNPVNFRDPSGHVIAAVPGLIVGGIVGFVLGVGSEVAQGISSIAKGEDYNWGKGALHIVNATLTGGIAGGALGATLNPVAAGIAGGAVGAGLNAWTDSLFVKETSLNEKAVRALEKAFIGGAAGGAAVLTGYVAGIFLSGISTGNAYVNAVLPYANTLLSGAAAAVGYGDVYRKLDGQQNTLKNAAVDAVFGAAAAGIGITVNASVEYFMARGAHQTDLWKAQEEAVRLSRNKSCDDGLDETEALYDRIFEQQRMVNTEYEEYLQELQKIQGEGSLGEVESGTGKLPQGITEESVGGN